MDLRGSYIMLKDHLKTYLPNSNLRRGHIVLYVGINIIVCILTIVNLSLQEWFDYCWWHIGLVNVDPTGDFYGLEEWDTLSELRDKICGDRQDEFEKYCPNICDNIYNFSYAGGLMILTGVLVLLSSLLTIFLHVQLYRKPHIRVTFVGKYIMLPFIFYFLGILCYVGIINLPNLEKVHQHDLSSEDAPSDPEYNLGLILAIFNTGMTGCIMMYGICVTWRTFA